MKIINFKEFLQERGIKFDTDKKAVRWLLSLKLDSTCRIANTYFVDKSEIERAFLRKMQEKKEINKKRRENGKMLAKKKLLSQDEKSAGTSP